MILVPDDTERSDIYSKKKKNTSKLSLEVFIIIIIIETKKLI